MKSTFFKLVLLVGLVWSQHVSAEVSLSEVKAYVNNHKRDIEKCNDIDVKKHGEKIKTLDVIFQLNENCEVRDSGENIQLNCSSRNMSDQRAVMRSPSLILHFDSEGSFIGLERSQNGGYLDSTTGGRREVYRCDRNGRTVSELPLNLPKNCEEGYGRVVDKDCDQEPKD